MILHPSSGPRPTDSHAELGLYEALTKHGPASWTGWHSLRLRVAGGTHSEWEGEGDFVLADPKRGLLVLEVKGGRMELSDGRWLQNGKPLKAAPRDQAQRFVRNLVAELQRRNVEAPPFGVACAFPDCDFSEGPKTGDLNGIVLGRRDFPHLAEALPEVMNRAVPARPVPRSKEWLAELHKLWGATWVPHVRLPDRTQDAAARRVALDREQLLFLDMAEANERALVEGGAGTGKSIIASELCRRSVRAGKRALYLCFTDALAAVVDAQFAAEFAAESPSGDRPRAVAVRQYAAGLLRAAGVSATPSDHTFWQDVSLQAACDALPAPELRPDIVVVDECQDFEEADWTLVEQLAVAGTSADRKLWAFGDERQAFWGDRKPPAALFERAAKLKLVKQYRCPEGLFEFASRYRTGMDVTNAAAGTAANGPDASVLRLSVATSGAVLDRVRHELDVLRKDGARPEDIAVVTLSGQTRSELLKESRLGGHALARADAPEVSTRVVADTFLRFKGLERPYVIVTETYGKHVTHYETRMHIALTRANVAAVVVTDKEGVKVDPRLGVLAR